MLTEELILEQIKRERLQLYPLDFTLLELPKASRADACFQVSWHGGQVHRFIVEIKSRNTPQVLQAAAHQAKSWAFDAPGSFPLVLVPYLSPSSLDAMEQLGVSAVDLCGNGIVQIPHQWLVVRAGSPNRFRGSAPIRGPYRGVASLVARAFLAKPVFARVSDVQSFIEERAGAITLATVSKTLARLEEDLVVARGAGGLRLMQPEKLLEELKGSYQQPSIRSRLVVKSKMPLAVVSQRLRAAAKELGGRVILSGLTSASKQTPIATEPVASFYCSLPPKELLTVAAIDASPERNFPDLELLQTDDIRVYFDAREQDGVHIASPVQTWLELATGDKRAQEAADALHARLLRESSTNKEMRPDVR